MTNEVVKVEQFMGIPVRIVETNEHAKMIPLNDIADGILYDRSTLRKLFNRNIRVLGKFSGKVIMASPQGVQETICLTRDGITGVIMKLDIERIKSEDKQNQIIKFQDWAIDTLGKVMDNKINEIKPFAKPVIGDAIIAEKVSANLQIASAISKYGNVDLGIAISMALSKVEFDTGADLTMWKNITPKGKPAKRLGVLLATDLGVELGFGNNSGKSINQILIKLGFLNRINGQLVLTQRGEQYAEAYPITGISPTGKSYARYDIKWQSEMVDILRKHLYDDPPKPEHGLITGYI